MQAVAGTLARLRPRQKGVVVTSLEASLPALAALCNSSGIRCEFIVLYIKDSNWTLNHAIYTLCTRNGLVSVVSWWWGAGVDTVWCRYCVVRGTDCWADQVEAVQRWAGESRLSVLLLCGLQSQAGLDLSPADTAVLLESGPGVWQPVLDCPTLRLVSQATVEEGLDRVETVRKILLDIRSVDSLNLTSQTISEVFNPPPDNGFTRKKDKVCTQVILQGVSVL